jgi:hypothetical protein
MSKIVTDIVSSLVEPVTGLISEFITDKDKQAEIAYKVATLAATQAHDQAILQLDINRESAKHASLFVAGARPAAIWVGVIGLFLVLVFFPLVVFVYGIWGHDVPTPAMDTITLFALLGPLLGLGGMRMVESIKGVERTTLGKQ